MKGVILHGGNGTRLRPLTYTDVKQLLPIAGKPVSEYVLEGLMEIGIKEVNIIVGEIGANEVRGYYGDGSKWGLKITYTFQEKPMGIAHAISLAKDFTGQDEFVVVLGDNYFHDGLTSLFHKFRNTKCDALVALTKVRNPSQFGVAEIEGGKIRTLLEKPKKPKSDLAIAGAYFLKPAIYDIISGLKPSWRGELEITEAFQTMLQSGMSIAYSIIEGWWKDTGTADEFLECNRMILDKMKPSENTPVLDANVFGRVAIGKGTSIDRESRIMGPVFIGEGTIIEQSYIGPYTSIGSNCIIKHSEIEDTVIMDGCSIVLRDGKRIRQSLVGPNSKIDPLENDLKPIKLILGRDTKLEI